MESEGLQGVPELERMRNLCYLEGKTILSSEPEKRRVFERLQRECPNVPSRELVLLFHLKDAALIQAAAHRLEYNATHRRLAPGPEDDEEE